MSETTPPVPPSETPEPPTAADVSQKKQTVRISLPPKPTGGPSIRVPMATSAPVAATAGLSLHSAASAAPVAAKQQAAPAVAAPAAKASPVSSRPAAPAKSSTLSGVDMGLAFASMVLAMAAAGFQFFVAQ